MKTLAALLLCGLALSSCTTTASKSNFETGATALAGSERLREAVTERCIARARNFSPEARHNAALVMDVKDSQADRLSCTRMVNAIATGRLTYAEVEAMRYGHISPKIVRILQGR